MSRAVKAARKLGDAFSRPASALLAPALPLPESGDTLVLRRKLKRFESKMQTILDALPGLTCDMEDAEEAVTLRPASTPIPNKAIFNDLAHDMRSARGVVDALHALVLNAMGTADVTRRKLRAEAPK